VSSLENQMFVLMAKVVQLEECDLYMTEIVEAASEQLQCKLLGAPNYFCQKICLSWPHFLFSGILLDPTVEDHRVSE
jgi:hypothetical protein